MEDKKPKQELKFLVRVQNTDLEGKKPLRLALTKIAGVGLSFANALLTVANIDKDKKAGHLNDSEIKKIEAVIQDPVNSNIPSWIFNRRNDYETGDDKHLTMSDLKFQKQLDIKKLQKIKSYRGLRLQVGLTVRGQRTKSNFRRNKGKGVGVKKKGPQRK